MPKRKTVKRFETEDLQGEDSYVVITGLKVKEVKALRKLDSDDDDFDAFEGGLNFIRQHVLDWNWVDDLGEPLPTPKEDPDVVYELTNEESEFLANIISGGETEELKN